MDQLKERADAIREAAAAGGGEGGSAVGPEECEVLLAVKGLKARYREEHTERKLVQSEVEYTERLSKECTRNLVTDFDAWCVAAMDTVVSPRFRFFGGSSLRERRRGRAQPPWREATLAAADMADYGSPPREGVERSNRAAEPSRTNGGDR
eukprot:9497913-Pyramimonas_sp.AAC.1